MTQIGLRFEARCRRPDDGHLPVRADPRRARALRGRPRRRSARQAPGRAAARAEAAARAASRPARRRASTAARIDFSRARACSPATIRRRCSRSSGARAMHPRQLPCWITHTNARTHEIIRGGLDRSPLFTGVIKGVGPRYCPSIEDKVVRFAERTSRTRSSSSRKASTTHEIYPNGISTSLPFDVQLALVRSMPGCEHAHILRPGYSIEYDYFDPRGLQRDARDQGDRAACSSPARSTARPATRRRPRRGMLAGINAARYAARRRRLVPAARRSVPRRAGRRPDHTRRIRAVPHVHVARRVPAAAARGQRRPAPDRARPQARRRRRRALGRLSRASATRRARARAAQVDVRHAERRCARTTPSACSASRSSASTRSPTCCAGPASPTRALHDAAGRGHAGRPMPIVAEQVEIATKYAGYIDRQQRRGRAAPRARGDAACRPDLDYRQRARAVDRGAAEAQSASARDARPGVAHLGRHAGCDLAAARAPEARLRRRARHDAPRRRRSRSAPHRIGTSPARRRRRCVGRGDVALPRGCAAQARCVSRRCSPNGTGHTT